MKYLLLLMLVIGVASCNTQKHTIYPTYGDNLKYERKHPYNDSAAFKAMLKLFEHKDSLSFIHSTVELAKHPFAFTIHTDFDITDEDSLKHIIANIQGVENDFNFLWGANKYDFLVIIGEMFNRDEVALQVQQAVEKYINDKAFKSL